MTPMTRVQILLISLCVLLAGAFLYQFSTPSQARTVPTLTVKQQTVAIADVSFVTPPLESFAALEARPPFNPLRTPFDKQKEQDELEIHGPPPLPSMFLIGVIIDGERRLAILKTDRSPLAESFEVGAQVGGRWSLKEVEPDRIVLESGKFKHKIELHSASNRRPAPKAPPAPQPAPAPQQKN